MSQPDPTPTLDAIRRRRSVKRFTERDVGTDEIERLLELAVLAPNHRMTEPWEFVVLGPEARRACGDVKGRGRARWIDDAEVAEKVRQKMVSSIGAIPCILAFVQRLDDDPEVREEDFATVWMGIQNVLIGAVAMGLGTHVKTGAFLDEEGMRELLGVGEGKRILALVHLGEPSEQPEAKPREPARERTRWMD